MTLDWFDKYDGPKILNRSGGRWKCILAGKCPTTTAYGETVDEAVANCVKLAKQMIRVRQDLAREDAEKAAEYGTANMAVRFDEEEEATE